CHGLARHHMPIFKWQGNHYTGPARPKAMTENTILSDSLMSIVNWAKEHPGKGVDVMLRELSPIPDHEGVTEEETARAKEKQQLLVRDLLWLCEQGYILVFSNNTVSQPKTAPAPAQSQPKKEAKPAKGRNKAAAAVKEGASQPSPQEEEAVQPSDTPASGQESAADASAAKAEEAVTISLETEEAPAEKTPEAVPVEA
ncbi:MAG: hypothetical protein ACLS9G_08570, partial [Akkermansia sp.]